MSEGLDRDTIEDRLTRLATGELSPSDPEAAELLRSDPALAGEVERLRRTLGLLGYGAATEPPAALRERILAAQRGTRWGARLSRIPWRTVLAAAATLIAFVLWHRNRELERELALQREVAGLLQQPNVVLSFSLAGTGPASRAFGSALLDLDAKKAALILHRVPPLPEDRVYRLWAVVGDKAVICGEFIPGAGGQVQRQFAIPVHEYTAPVARLVVTDEAADGGQAPAGPTVMRSTS